MFVRTAALRPIPSFAVVEESTIDELEELLDSRHDDLQSLLDAGFAAFDHEQPVLAGFVAEELNALRDPLAQSLGYFLSITVYIAFDKAFGQQYTRIDVDALKAAAESLDTDQKIRAGDPTEVVESDDVVAMGQPHLIEFVQHHLEEALTQAGEHADLDQIDRVYRTILVMVIASSHAIIPMSGVMPPGTEVLA